MAKKVVATLRKEGGVEMVKAIKAVKIRKNGAYSFKEEIMVAEKTKDFFGK